MARRIRRTRRSSARRSQLVTCRVYLGLSLDGFIADKDGGVGWLDMVDVPAGEDLGYAAFMQDIDALVMGRVTFETVLGFDVPWPYDRPVYVWSRNPVAIPEALAGKAFGVHGTPAAVVAELGAQGLETLYVDGGKTVQAFLEADLIDTLILTRLPIVLGGGVPLFGSLPMPMPLEHVRTEVLLGQLVKSTYQRKPRASS